MESRSTIDVEKPMRKDSEKLLERKLVELCKKRGGMCIKLATLHTFGLPDRLCLLPGGRAFFVELKTTGQKPRKVQMLVHNKLRELGFEVHVVDNITDLQQLLNADREQFT